MNCGYWIEEWVEAIYERNSAREWAVRCYRRMRWVEGELDALRVAIRREHLITDDAKRRTVRMTEERDALQLELEDMRAELDILKATLDARETSEWHRLDAELDVKVERHRLGMQIDKLQAELADAHAELDAYYETSASLHRRIDPLQVERDDLATKLVTVVAERNALQEELGARDERRCETCRRWEGLRDDIGWCSWFKQAQCEHMSCIDWETKDSTNT